jgi:hypothetical protein
MSYDLSMTTTNDLEILRALRSLDQDGGLVALAELHRAVELGREEAEDALRSLSARGVIALYPRDNRAAMTAADRAAALVLCGVPQHLVCLA